MKPGPSSLSNIAAQLFMALNLAVFAAAGAQTNDAASAASGARTNDAAAAAPELRQRHADLQDALAHNAFGRPLVLQSTQDSGDLKGDIYVVVEHPFARVKAGLSQADNWCDILILHLNIKQCRAQPKAVSVFIGKKVDQPTDDAFQVDFAYRVAAQSEDYLKVQLDAESGPLGTRNYRIVLEAVPLDAGHSFLHLAYSYGYGVAARLAMQAYLATAGSSKVGFSVVGKDADGKPQYVGGVRGVVERNTMRYYLAIDAYLDSLAAPKGEQQEKRLRDWFAATERYATQLHELSEDDYLQMKRKEVARQSQK